MILDLDHWLNKAHFGDCRELLPQIPDESVDLVFTSPPYANRRKNVYDSIDEDDYVHWFTPIALEIKRILKPTGSFFLNIKPHSTDGERSLYVFDLVLHLKREVGFMYIDELSWVKHAFPGILTGRFKNAFEPIYHFTKQNPDSITFNPYACGTPIQPGSIARAYRKRTGAPKNGSGMTGMNTTNIRHLKLARPDNVLRINNISNQSMSKQKHPATFPPKLPEFFIKSYTNEGDVVIDMFGGTGITGVVARVLNRKFILMENKKSFYDDILDNLSVEYKIESEETIKKLKSPDLF